MKFKPTRRSTLNLFSKKQQLHQKNSSTWSFRNIMFGAGIYGVFATMKYGCDKLEKWEAEVAEIRKNGGTTFVERIITKIGRSS